MHIIFNSIDVDEGKVYHSYYGSYMNIRNQSDKLCKEHNLSVIDQETQREINEIKRRKFVSWHDWNEDKKGSSYKSGIQFDIDRVIRQSVNWQNFLDRMESSGYEIKFGKHIAFRKKGQQRFTRSKTIGDNYTEERIKDRILNKEKEFGNIIGIKNNEKAKSSKGYERWATKHNMTTAAGTIIAIRDKGFHSMTELESEIKRLSSRANQLRKEFRDKEFELKRIKEITKRLQICINKKAHYDGYRKNPNDKIYMMMNRKDVEAYREAYSEVEIFIKQFPHLKKEILEGIKRGDGKSIFKKLNQHSKSLHDIQKELAKEHDKLQEKRSELDGFKANIDQYLGRKEVPKKSIRQQIKRESNKTPEVKSKSRTKDIER
ncbi:relaxase/mobilization nuclease domain-containing protein [Streptococcus equi]|uniref:relaxase/mobilization nuclease domain-containing protein n=1 Tax=Streptococcus equi TaxID=1336 RepID=UPI002F2B56A3